ncbi:serine hydrolase [Sulfobacillus harzensis]|uniref:Serine hydrolase n=1 Tax=Sulfobacillus harzensis TaxID=2729629 RepID=A0A7Y0L0B7_9FIRM|nr:serine hydrolase [Sulfobacillus harzensis]NMP20984.1 serine hydrolase [Sulfobacillus harzensis]
MSIESLIHKLDGEYSLYAKNLKTGKAISWREHEVMPSASLIKVPIMAEIFRRVEEEHLDLDDTLTMKREDQVSGSGVLMDLTPGLKLSVRDLTTLMITVSDNTATNLLIDWVGVDAVNHVIRRLGLTHTALERRLQRVPTERARINRTTAYDMSLLMELLARGEAISAAVSEQMVGILQRCQAPISIAPAMPPSEVPATLPRLKVAHKTGSLASARHDSGIVSMTNGAYVATIMSQGAPESVLLRNITRLGRELYRALR